MELVDFIWMVIIGLFLFFLLGLVIAKFVKVINKYIGKKKEKITIDNVHENIIQEN